MINTIFIEAVANGFIVHENFEPFDHHRHNAPTISKRRVFNIKKQLNNYINKSIGNEPTG